MFLSDLKVKKTGANEWELLEPLRYACVLLDRVIEVPAGFRTDFASVPRLPVIYAVFGNKAHQAAVVHDWLYMSQAHPDEYTVGERTPISRKMADDIFHEALTGGYPAWKANLMWAAVRIGGSVYWAEGKRA